MYLFYFLCEVRMNFEFFMIKIKEILAFINRLFGHCHFCSAYNESKGKQISLLTTNLSIPVKSLGKEKLKNLFPIFTCSFYFLINLYEVVFLVLKRNASLRRFF